MFAFGQVSTGYYSKVKMVSVIYQLHVDINDTEKNHACLIFPH